MAHTEFLQGDIGRVSAATCCYCGMVSRMAPEEIRASTIGNPKGRHRPDCPLLSRGNPPAMIPVSARRYGPDGLIVWQEKKEVPSDLSR